MATDNSVRETEAKIKEMLNERNEISNRNRRRPGFRGGRPGEFNVGANQTPIGAPLGQAFGKSPEVPRESLLSPEEKTIETRPDLKATLDKPTMKRGARLMGGLLGHLKKAKSAEERAQSNSSALKKKIEAEQIVEKKIQNFSENLREARRLDAISRKNEDLVRKRELRINIMVEERKLIRLKLEQHYQPMMNFVRTDTGPSLFFMPKNLNPTMEAKIKDTRAKIDNKIQSLRTEFNEETLRAELMAQQEEWEAEHPLREVEIRDKAEMLEERARRQAEREAREKNADTPMAETKEEEGAKDENKAEEKIDVEE